MKSTYQSAFAFAAVALGVHAAAKRLTPRSTFRERTVVITGGSRGLGLALARCFASEGARLALLARSAEQLESAAAQLRRTAAVEVLPLVCDVRDAGAIDRAVAAIVERFGAIEVLVNNAGIIQAMPFENAQLEDFRDSLDTHFWAPLRMTRACLPHFPPQGGRIVNIASIGGRIAIPHLLPYVAGKFALVGLSEGLHAELRHRGIHVTTVTPHLMQTGSHRNVRVRGRHEQEARWFALGTATRLTALNADRAARQIVEATRHRRAHVTPGWQARAAEITQALAPELTAALLSTAATAMLPAPATDPGGAEARESRDLNLGTTAHLFATDAARKFNQRIAPDELATGPH
jgi:short-subunit dehydrogenase